MLAMSSACGCCTPATAKRATCDVRMKHRTREWRTIEIHHMALTYRLPDAPLGLIALALDATQLPQMQKAMRHDLARLARNV
jgi:hypothetical protein